MKKICHMLMFLVVVGFSTGCEEFLTERPFTFLGPTNFYRSEADAVAAINGVYEPMTLQQHFGRTIYILADLTGDEMLVISAFGVRGELFSYTYAANNDEIANWWNNSYVVINRANDVLKNVPGISMNETLKNNILSQAKFLRALNYFYLVRFFGDVPLLTEPTTSLAELNVSRTPAAQVYSQIITDLLEAEASLPVETQIPAAQKGRASKGAATSLLAKVYLTRGYLPFAQPNDFQNVVSKLEEVMNSGTYRLVTNYTDVFDVTKENGPEHVFNVKFELPPNRGNITPRMFEPTLMAGFASFFPFQSFIDSYDPADVRRAHNFRTTTPAGAVLPRPHVAKYFDPNRIGNDSRCDWPVLRYADVLLMHSEAINQINAGDARKYQGLNAVRERAGLAPIDNVEDKEAFQDVLVQERSWELCYEGHRRFDLIRMGRLFTRLEATGRTAEQRHLLLPIPQIELDLNVNLAPQNPGF
jgi:hypothetical protein